jgi:hypothetical protein
MNFPPPLRGAERKAVSRVGGPNQNPRALARTEAV